MIEHRRMRGVWPEIIHMGTNDGSTPYCVTALGEELGVEGARGHVGISSYLVLRPGQRWCAGCVAVYRAVHKTVVFPEHQVELRTVGSNTGGDAVAVIGGFDAVR